jgi:lysozyme
MIINPKVVDLSHHNTPTSFVDAYKFGIRGIIHKASQGLGMVDQTYAKRKTQALDAGLLWGAYHFAENSDPIKQVHHFFDTVKPDDNTLMALDYEPNTSHTMTLEQAKAFLVEGEKLLGRKLVLYSGNLIKETLKHPDPYINAHKLWLAQYGPTAHLPVGWTDYWIWQYTGDGTGPTPHTIPGLGSGLDINSYNHSDEQLAQEWAGEVSAPKEVVQTLIIPPPTDPTTVDPAPNAAFTLPPVANSWFHDEWNKFANNV